MILGSSNKSKTYQPQYVKCSVKNFLQNDRSLNNQKPSKESIKNIKTFYEFNSHDDLYTYRFFLEEAVTQSILANQVINHVTKPRLFDSQRNTEFPNGLPITESDKKLITNLMKKITI